MHARPEYIALSLTIPTLVAAAMLMLDKSPVDYPVTMLLATLSAVLVWLATWFVGRRNAAEKASREEHESKRYKHLSEQLSALTVLPELIARSSDKVLEHSLLHQDSLQLLAKEISETRNTLIESHAESRADLSKFVALQDEYVKEQFLNLDNAQVKLAETLERLNHEVTSTIKVTEAAQQDELRQYRELMLAQKANLDSANKELESLWTRVLAKI